MKRKVLLMVLYLCERVIPLSAWTCCIYLSIASIGTISRYPMLHRCRNQYHFFEAFICLTIVRFAVRSPDFLLPKPKHHLPRLLRHSSTSSVKELLIGESMYLCRRNLKTDKKSSIRHNQSCLPQSLIVGLNIIPDY